MAGGMDLGTSPRGRKSLDATLNLVPFIDLMAVTIVFLIMTAVWTQLGKLRVNQLADSEGNQPERVVPISLALGESSLRLTVGGVPDVMLPFTRTASGALEVGALAAKLEELNAQFPEAGGLTLFTDDGVPYADLVRVIDACSGHHFPNVSVAPGI